MNNLYLDFFSSPTSISKLLSNTSTKSINPLLCNTMVQRRRLLRDLTNLGSLALGARGDFFHDDVLPHLQVRQQITVVLIVFILVAM